jgi:LuxR family maltose regulon positive regulatory protein
VALPGTKLHRPRPRRQLVPRSRLVDQLPWQAGPLPRLILVCAPAGFGKTTLLSQWLARWQTAPHAEPRRVAWISLDAEDSDPRLFLTNLVAAVQAAAPDVGVDHHRLQHRPSV